MPTKNCPTTLTLTRMTKAEAAALLKRMLGSYPSLNLHDPETYMAAVCSLFMSYPLWAGEAAADKAMMEAKFAPPTPGVLKPHLEDEVRTARYVEEWNRGAAQLALPPPPRADEETHRAFIAKRRTELGPNFGIGGTARDRAAEDRAYLVAQIGQETYDAIPDAGTEGWRTIGEKVRDKARALAELQGVE